MNDKYTLEKTDSIAYNPTVRQQIEKLHSMLGAELTDITNEIVSDEPGALERGWNLLKEVSKLTSELSVVLLELKGKKSLNEEERYNYDSIKSLVGSLGNLQFQLNNILKYRKTEGGDTKLAEMAIDLEQNIINAQEEFRKVRSNINDLGFLSYDPNISFEYNKKNRNTD